MNGVLILDFGGQYKELIARRVRQMHIYSEIARGDMSAAAVRERAPLAIILTGGPSSVYTAGAATCDPEIFTLGIPILGICYGMQLMAHMLGGKVAPCDEREYGVTQLTADTMSPLFTGLPEAQTALMSHTDQVVTLPDGFTCAAGTKNCKYAAMQDVSRRLYGVQFHPETNHTDCGTAILRNFLFGVCGAAGDYNTDDYIERQIAAVREQVGDARVILGLSGGVDSAVCAALLSRAIPGQLTCIFVDHGCMRKNEGAEIAAAFSGMDLTLITVDAGERFLTALAGVSEPERKRHIIGEQFVRVFGEQAAKLTRGKTFLAQGTIYPDVIESGVGGAAIKSHHNVGGLPEDMPFEGIVEPLRGLFKDEVRAVGMKLGLPEAMCQRQPFPGPGLAIRIIGEITSAKLDMLKEADAIFRCEIEAAGVPASQYFAALTDMHSVGVMGDARTYDYTVALRAVVTDDFMTCDYAPLPHELLSRVSRRITNEVRGVNRVMYDITGKPPATVEYE